MSISETFKNKSSSWQVSVDEETQSKRMKSRDKSISEEEITTLINSNKEFDEILEENNWMYTCIPTHGQALLVQQK